MAEHFCNCPVDKCPRHPANHNNGCDPCVKDNLQKGKMPACFFRAVNDDIDDQHDYSLKGFVHFYNRHQPNGTGEN